MSNVPEHEQHREAATPAPADRESADESLDLVTYFQPFYNLRSDGLQGLEALARRSGADGRPSLPAAFLSPDESGDKVREIDLWILDDALSHLARWYEMEGRTELILSVNFSRPTISHPGLVTQAAEILKRRGMPGERLLIDVTVDTLRGILTDDDATARTNLAGLREFGTTVCLDHFTAADVDILEAAVAVPVDIIKLDPRELRAHSQDELAGVARSVQDTGLPAVASGVESQEQLDLVRGLDFEWAQGFFLGEPVEAAHALRPPSWLS